MAPSYQLLLMMIIRSSRHRWRTESLSILQSYDLPAGYPIPARAESACPDEQQGHCSGTTLRTQQGLLQSADEEHLPGIHGTDHGW